MSDLPTDEIEECIQLAYEGMEATEAKWDLANTQLQALSNEIKRLREWKHVADLFGIAFHMDEFGQYPVTNGEDVHAATLAWEKLRLKESRTVVKQNKNTDNAINALLDGGLEY